MTKTLKRKKNITKMKWRTDSEDTDKKIEQDLKRKGVSLLEYANSHGIGYLSLTVFPDYISCTAKKDAEAQGYTANIHAFKERVK